MHALVIGATGGIGGAIRSRLSSDGATVLTAGRKDADLHLDFDEPDSIQAAAVDLAERVERLHLLVVASGILHGQELDPEKRFEDLDATTLTRYFRINAIGPALVARHFFPFLSHDERAVFAAISARVGSIGDNRLGGWYGYRSSKAALNMLLKTLAIEAGRRADQLIVAALHPGTVDTSLSAPFQSRVPEERLFSPDHSARQLLEVIRRLRPEDSGGFFAYDGQAIEW
ncbi:MAG: SDR family NAD(P)-dependent oxidoreductase [Xanthomonadales bacterium]|nr:SDR family NAD(P)-dependent oxidoreductase [Xanthomonadales bacterium]